MKHSVFPASAWLILALAADGLRFASAKNLTFCFASAGGVFGGRKRPAKKNQTFLIFPIACVGGFCYTMSSFATPQGHGRAGRDLIFE